MKNTSIFIALSLCFCSSCKTPQYIPIETTRTEYRDIYLRDSIYFRDSIFLATKGKDISAEMLKAGMVWHYKEYSEDNEYAELENAACQQKVGLWVDKNPVAPWEFRKKK